MPAATAANRFGNGRLRVARIIEVDEDDIVVLHSEGAESTTEEQHQYLADMIGAKLTIVLKPGESFDILSDDDLERLGLQRISEPEGEQEPHND